MNITHGSKIPGIALVRPSEARNRAASNERESRVLEAYHSAFA